MHDHAVIYFTHWNTHHSSLVSWKLFEANLSGRLGAPSGRKRVIANPLVKYPYAREL